MAKNIINSLRRWLTKLIGLVAILIILFVLLLSLLKLTLPYWVKQKPTIVELVQTNIKGQFDYKNLDIEWNKFHPIIKLKEVVWQLPEKKFELTIEQAQIEVDVWKTLYYGFLATKSIELSDSQITIELLAERTEPLSFEELLDIDSFYKLHPEVFQQENITANNVVVNLIKQEQEIRTHIIRARLQNFAQQQQLIIDARGDLFNRVRFVSESYINQESQSYLKLYTDIAHLKVDKLQSFANETISLPLNNANIRSWLNITDGQISDSVLQINSQATAQSPTGIEFEAHFKLNQQNLQIKSETFIIEQLLPDGELVRYPSHFSLLREKEKRHFNWQLSAQKVPIEYLAELSVPFVESQLLDYIGQAKPKGIIDFVELEVQQSEQQWLPISANFQINNFFAESYGKLPQFDFDGLSLWQSDDEWHYLLHKEGTKLIWPPVFIEAIPVDNLLLAGRLEFKQDKRIIIDNFSFEGPDAKAYVEGSITIDPDNDVELALQAQATDINIANLYRYWPRNGMSEKTLDYLDNSLKSGQVKFAKMIWRGSVEAFPYSDFSGQFDVQAKVENADYKFHEDWPMASDLNALASFENEAIKVKAQSGNLYGVQLLRAKALIPDLTKETSELFLDISANTSHQDFKQVFFDSPLQEALSAEFLELEFSERLTTDLKIDLALTDDSQANVDGSIELVKQSLTGIPYDIDLRNIYGVIRYTENGAIGQDLQAELLNNAVVVDLKVGDFTDDGDLIQIDAKADVSINKLLPELGFSGQLSTKGLSTFNIHYRVDDLEPANESLIVRSGLQGTQITGPNWLSKNSKQVSPLLFTLLKKGPEVKISSIYRDTLNAKLDFNSDDMDSLKGLIALGGIATQELPFPDSGVAIEGYFEQINVSQWLDAFNYTSNQGIDSFRWPKWIDHINLTTPSLLVAGQTFDSVRINDEKFADEEIRFNLFSEQAKGSLSIFDDGRKRIVFEQFDIELEPFEQMSDGDLELSPSELANWQFECSFCIINGINTGQLTLLTKQSGQTIVLEGDSQVENHLTAYIEGRWQDGATDISIDFSSPDSGKLLEVWGFGNGIKKTAATGQINLNWPGGFHQFELANLNGNIVLDTRDGVIKELSDKQARIFSLFSLQSIRRRLSLDFSDLFEDGFFYDKITGRFSIKNGVINSDKVDIKGTAAEVAINGTIDLIEETVDQNVTVIPKLSSSLPIIAGWALEPTTGVIMFLVNKIFEPVIDVVSSIEYQIKGSIQAPEVVELSKKSKRVKLPEEQTDVEQKELLQERLESEQVVPGEVDKSADEQIKES